MANDTSRATDKTPITTHAMWQVAYDDFVHADIMARAAREDPNASRDVVARWERVRRIRMATANALEFLITNESDIDAVIAGRKKRGG
ncbi:hypothetical protein [Bradyrhizobium erythrophlei]|uniref:Uncharacterized protein n=1 Tax=Bradyrhizobium erythrophlei TaxID=1437360 RepID=A0A1M5NDD4_9BRAD|nr:hypothetical protein [Bradyrhizobium erythrophlei]SHG87521.1 hypothetical protein SAMN05443248_2947 [Bradyrhizobium erythrophlei]